MANNLPPIPLQSFLNLPPLARAWLLKLEALLQAIKKDVSFLVLGTDPTVPNARVLTTTAALTTSDGGAGGNFQLGLNTTGVTAGTYDLATITVNSTGQVTAASSNTSSGGTWTPTTGFTGTMSGVTFAVGYPKGVWSKVGNVYTFAASFVFTSLGTSTGDSWGITNLPALSSSASTLYPVSIIAKNLAAGVTSVTAGVLGATTNCPPYKFASGSYAGLNVTDMTNTTELYFCGQYFV